jgi:hypothetical protein
MRVHGFMSSWVHEFMGSWVHGVETIPSGASFRRARDPGEGLGDGHARRDLPGSVMPEERQLIRNVGVRAARPLAPGRPAPREGGQSEMRSPPKSPDRVAPGDFSSRGGWVQNYRRGQALVEMTTDERHP